MNLALISFDKLVAYLLAGTVFFAMRSCEYLLTGRGENQRKITKNVGNLRFFKNKRLVPH